MSQPPIPPEPFEPSPPPNRPPDPAYGNAAYEPGYASARVPSPPPYNQGPAEPYAGVPARKRLPGWAIALIVLGILGLLACGGIFAACAATTNSAVNSINDAVASDQAEAVAKTADVKLKECKPGNNSVAGPTVNVILEVKNSGSEVRDYAVDLEFLNADKVRIDTDTAYVQAVGPGQTARYDEATFLDEGTRAATCRILAVS